MSSQNVTTPDGGQGPRKRRANSSSDARYPRKRSSKACHVCRGRKTKCDNVRPTCGFCASINIHCSYDDVERDHSTFDPATLEILRQLGQISNSQDTLLRVVLSVAEVQSRGTTSILSPTATNHLEIPSASDTVGLNFNENIQEPQAFVGYDWQGNQQPESASTSPAASTSVAAVRWFGLFANDTSRESFPDVNLSQGTDSDLLDSFGKGEDGEGTTPLQRATEIIDGQPLNGSLSGDKIREEDMWQSLSSISLLSREQNLFENFLRRICSWLDLFDPAQTFSTRVPHLAARNAGLLNAIMALSSYHQSLDEDTSLNERADQNTALQYYYQTLHYVQKAMRYPSYQHSLELMATTLIISTYEMLRGSRNDWQRHLQGVFWILRSRQIEVETSSLESTTWWAWLRQDIWAAFRERRRTYSTWMPKKTCAELSSHELASRAVWILAQVVNFCAVNTSEEEEMAILVRRREWAQALWKMLQEWESYLTMEFSELPASSHQSNEVFRPRLIHPQCFGLAMQVHHVSRILVHANEPSSGNFQTYMDRQKQIQTSIEIVCGIGLTLVEDVSSMLSSQCLFIAGMFMQDRAQRNQVLEMLESCRKRCRWPAPSLGSELEEIWAEPDKSRAS